MSDHKIQIEETRIMNQSLIRSASALAMLGLMGSTAFAADGFKLRYPFQGSLGGEIAAPLNQPGWFASLAVVHIDIDKLSGEDGNHRGLSNSGVIKNPANANGAPIGKFGSSATVSLKQQQTNAAFILGYAFEDLVGGGRIVASAQLPYTTQLNRSLTTDNFSFATTPTPPVPSIPATVATQVEQGVKGILADFSKKNSANVSGQGDAEVTAAWAYQKDAVKVVAGMTVALPTGDYNSSVGLLGQAGVAGVNIGFGNYYTLRPGIAVAYAPSSDWTIGAKASYGINTRNKDNDIKSGDYVGIDLAAVYKTPIGVIGPHFIYVDQVKDDTYGARSVNQAQTFGANRFNMQGAGLVFTTIIPGTDAGLTLSYMTTMESKNALSGSFTMVRLTKKF
jgi:hypothetical protein